MKTMKQALMTSPGTIVLQEVELREPGPDEVVLKIMRVGVCGSDIHVYHGLHPYTSFPVVQGHEVSGLVETVGSATTGFRPGDKVTVMPQVVCGQCRPCRTGQYHICDKLRVMGFQTTGMASERFVVKADNCLKFPSSASWEEGAMIEPLAVAVHAVRRLGDVKDFDIVVYGAGPIGNLTAQTAKYLGARRVLITDTSEYRLKLAETCGVDYTVNAASQDVGQAIALRFGEDKADASLECVGIQPTVDQAILNARKGSAIVIVGVFGEKPKVDLGLVQDRELRLLGTLMYQREDYLTAIEMLQTHRVSLQPLMSKHFGFQEFLAAYHYIEANKEKTMKVFIDIGSDA